MSWCSAHRDGAVRPSSPPHGGHGGSLVHRCGRVGSSRRGSRVSQLADFPGGGHAAPGPVAPLLVVSQKTTKRLSAVGKHCVVGKCVFEISWPLADMCNFFFHILGANILSKDVFVFQF